MIFRWMVRAMHHRRCYRRQLIKKGLRYLEGKETRKKMSSLFLYPLVKNVQRFAISPQSASILRR